MKRYEAFITKNWRDTGVANVAVARIDDSGGASAGFFLVDHFCLGVKDAFLLDDLMESELREIIEERFPEGTMERMHPAWAKKFVEGAVTYAENLGFSPHRDYRKARRAFSGIDTSICTETFTYGDNGRPHFIQGNLEDEERVERIIAALNARVGPDGYACTLREDVLADPGISNENLAETRALVARALENLKSKITVPVVAGVITAMLCMPDEFDSDEAIDMLEEMIEVNKDAEKSPPDERNLATFDNTLEIYWAQLDALLEYEMGTDDPYPMDFSTDDFPDQNTFLMALFHWAHGFMSVAEGYEDTWAVLRARPDLADHWKTMQQWSNPSAPGGLFEELDKDDADAPGKGKRATPLDAAIAILSVARSEPEEPEEPEEQDADE